MALDLYAIDDAAPTPDDPGHLQTIGSITAPEHRSLAPVWSALGPELNVPYAEDSRLDAAHVLLLRDGLLANADTGAGQNTVVVRSPPCSTSPSTSVAASSRSATDGRGEGR